MSNSENPAKPKYKPLWTGGNARPPETTDGCMRCVAVKRLLNTIDPTITNSSACSECTLSGTSNAPSSEKDRKNV